MRKIPISERATDKSYVLSCGHAHTEAEILLAYGKVLRERRAVKLQCTCGLPSCGTCRSREYRQRAADGSTKLAPWKKGPKPRCVCGECKLCLVRAWQWQYRKNKGQ